MDLGEAVGIGLFAGLSLFVISNYAAYTHIGIKLKGKEDNITKDSLEEECRKGASKNILYKAFHYLSLPGRERAYRDLKIRG